MQTGTDSNQVLSPDRVALTPLTGTFRGETYVFDLPSVIIGRGRRNDVAFDSYDDATVSTYHAQIRAEQGRHVIYDMGSLSGTFVNDGRVDRRVLADGDTIQFGKKGPRLLFNVKYGASGG